MGIGLADLFADANYEMALAVLPLFLTAGLGAPAFAVGVVEGVADGSSALIKVLSGWYSDRTRFRKGIATTGYAVTVAGFAAFALIGAWPQAILARAFGWMGRGLRQPIRSAMLAGSVERVDLGKAFGFHEAMDTLGALAGPAIAYFVLATQGQRSFRTIFEIALVPGVLCVLVFALRTRDPRQRRAQTPADPQGASAGPARDWVPLPAGFWRFLTAVAVFGAGNFAPAFLILRAAAMLKPEFGAAQSAAGGVAFFLAYNAVGTAAAYPGGWLADRFGAPQVVAGGYALFGAACLAGIIFSGILGVAVLALLAGTSAPLVTAQENAVAGELVEERFRGTGYGVLAGVNGAGDLISSIVTGALWSAVGSWAGLGYGLVLSLAGAALLLGLRPARSR